MSIRRMALTTTLAWRDHGRMIPVAPRGLLVAKALVGGLVVVLVASCGSRFQRSNHDPQSAPPTSMSDCNSIGWAGGDGGVALGWEWYTGDHRLNSAATVYFCFGADSVQTVLMSSDNPVVAVAPRRFRVPDSSNGVAPFRVTATAPGKAHLTAKVLGFDGRVWMNVDGLVVVANGANWHLFCPYPTASSCG